MCRLPKVEPRAQKSKYRLRESESSTYCSDQRTVYPRNVRRVMEIDVPLHINMQIHIYIYTYIHICIYTCTSKMAKIMDPILHIVSILEYWAIILGFWRSRYVCIKNLDYRDAQRVIVMEKLLVCRQSPKHQSPNSGWQTRKLSQAQCRQPS